MVTEDTIRTIMITWSAPSERNGSLSYNVSFTGRQIPPYPQERALCRDGSFVVHDVSNTTHMLTNILPFAQYNIRVFAFNQLLGQDAMSPTEMRTIFSDPIRELYIVQ